MFQSKSSNACCKNSAYTITQASLLLSRPVAIQPAFFYEPTWIYTNNCCSSNCCSNSISSDDNEESDSEKKYQAIHTSTKVRNSGQHESFLNAQIKVDEKISEVKKKLENYEIESHKSRLREEELLKRLAQLELERKPTQSHELHCTLSNNLNVSKHIQGSQTIESTLNDQKCCCSLQNNSDHCDFCAHSHYYCKNSCLEERIRRVRETLKLPVEPKNIKRESVKINMQKSEEVNFGASENYAFNTIEKIQRPKTSCSHHVSPKPPWKITGIVHNSSWAQAVKKQCLFNVTLM